jgi:peroxiredoxin Q/BCP
VASGDLVYLPVFVTLIPYNRKNKPDHMTDNEILPGVKAPDFSLPDHTGEIHTSASFLGSWYILYFYPRDNTSSCTAEAVAFSEVYDELSKIGVPVIGISPDTMESHRKFIEKHDLKITLLSDINHEVIEAYGAWKQKKMYGKSYMGVERSTFLIDRDGVIREIWRKVRVKDHVQTVTKRLHELMESS